MHDLVFIVYAFLALFLLLLASPPHFKSGNIGACILVVWSFSGTLGFLVNAIQWWDNIGDPAPVFCDIWTKLHIAVVTGICSGCLCINRRLKIISSAKRSNVSARERRLELWIDLAIGLVPSAFVMAIHYTVQGNRYNIMEGFGCAPATYWSKWAIVGLLLPALLVGLGSFVYGALAIYNFASRRLQFQKVLQTSGGGLNTSRFVRLVSLSTIEMLLSVPLSIYGIANVSRTALRENVNFADVHEDWYRVDKYTGAVLKTLDAFTVTSAQRWMPVFAAFVYFAFFGMQDEALMSYKARALWLAKTPRQAINKMRGRSTSSHETNGPPSRAHLPNLGSAVAAVSPSTPYFPGRSQEDLESGGLSLKMTNDGEKDSSLGYKPSGIAVRVERSVA